MGNRLLVKNLPEMDFTRPPLPHMRVLSNCSLYAGSKHQVLELFYKYSRLYRSPDLTVKPWQVSSFLKYTASESLQPVIMKTFAKPEGLNLLELLAALIVYSSEPVSVKLKLVMYVFDFDGNHKVTQDELEILVRSFMAAVECMTGSELLVHSQAALQALSISLGSHPLTPQR